MATAGVAPRIMGFGPAPALGHPLGASGARLVTTAVNQLHRNGGALQASPLNDPNQDHHDGDDQ